MQIGFLSFYVIHYLYEYSISYKSYKTFQSNKHQRLPDQPNYIISNSLQYFLSTHKVHTPVHILCQKNHDKDHQPIQPTSHLPPILNSFNCEFRLSQAYTHRRLPIGRIRSRCRAEGENTQRQRSPQPNAERVLSHLERSGRGTEIRSRVRETNLPRVRFEMVIGRDERRGCRWLEWLGFGGCPPICV